MLKLHFIFTITVIYLIIPRYLLPVAKERATKYPVITVTDPRRSGKNTLCRQAFPDKSYANLERPDTRNLARNDPKRFLITQLATDQYKVSMTKTCQIIDHD